MKKLSEILKLAMPAYQHKIDFRLSRNLDTSHTPAMCYVISDLKVEGVLTKEEQAAFSLAIEKRLGDCAYLATRLRSQKKGASWQHRVAYYKRWIEQLEKKGL